MPSLHATDATPTVVTHADTDEAATSPVIDPRRAGLAATALAVLAAVASFACWQLMPSHHLDPSAMLPAIVATQVVGAIGVLAWLAWSRRRPRR